MLLLLPLLVFSRVCIETKLPLSISALLDKVPWDVLDVHVLVLVLALIIFIRAHHILKYEVVIVVASTS